MTNEATIPKPPKVVVAPEGCGKYLTAGKEYPVNSILTEWDEETGYFFTTFDDNGEELVCAEKTTFLYNDFDWIIKEREA